MLFALIPLLTPTGVPQLVAAYPSRLTVTDDVKDSSPRAEGSLAVHGEEVLSAVADNALPIPNCGETPVAAGELGRGKLISVTVTLWPSLELLVYAKVLLALSRGTESVGV